MNLLLSLVDAFVWVLECSLEVIFSGSLGSEKTLRRKDLQIHWKRPILRMKDRKVGKHAATTPMAASVKPQYTSFVQLAGIRQLNDRSAASCRSLSHLSDPLLLL